MRTSPIYTPSNMVARNTWTVANTAMTGASQRPVRRIRMFARTTCQKVQSRKEPSCPSQKQLAINFIGMARLLCFHT